MVFDDGNKTFFKFDRRVPAIFAVNADFSETLRNFRREGEYIVVDGTATQFTLRDGNEWTCIFNLRKPDFGAPDPDILGPAEDHDGNKAARSGNRCSARPNSKRWPKATSRSFADRRVRRNQLLGGGVLSCSGWRRRLLRLGGSAADRPRDMLEGDEEFTTTTFRPPSFVREGERSRPAEPEIARITPPPPPPPEQAESDPTRPSSMCRRRRRRRNATR